MSLDDNKAMAHRFFGVQDVGELALVDTVVSADCIFHMPDKADNVEGPGQLKAHIAEQRMAFPDIRHSVEDTVAEGDKVAVRLTVRGTHEGEYGGIAPTGGQVVFTVVGILRISGGKVAEGWFDYDALGFMQQLGMELRPKE
jgi:predicted ester cyclase